MGISPFMASGCSCTSRCHCEDDLTFDFSSKREVEDERCKMNVPDIYPKPKKAKEKAKGKKAKKFVKKIPNVPDPSKFRFLRVASVGRWTIVEVQYEEAKNYEGRKIMVYEETPFVVEHCKVLDPHFCDGKHLSPFARFAPTEEGWEAALRFANNSH